MNKNGMSLISVMVSASIMAVISVGMMQMMQNQTKMVSKLTSDQGTLSVISEMSSILSDPINCALTLKNLDPTTGAPSKLVARVGAADVDKFEVSTAANPKLWGGEQIEISSYQLGTNFAVPILDGTTQTYLRITFVKRKLSYGVDSPTKILKINLVQNASGTIESCYAVGMAGDTIWKREGGAPDNIFYNGGNVGIGPPPFPNHRLSVEGLVYSNNEDWWGGFIGEVNSSVSSGHSAFFHALRSRGTQAARTYPQAGDSLGGFVVRDAIDGLKLVDVGGGSIVGYATENFSPTNKGTKLSFYTTNNGSASPSENMVVDHNGNVGIGATSPTSLLEVNGDITANALIYSSDARLKTKTKAMKNSLEALTTLTPIYFHWNEMAKEMRGLSDNERHIGFLAQNVERLFPELVKTGPDGLKAVNYPLLVVPLIGAINELAQRNQALQERLNRLEKIIESQH